MNEVASDLLLLGQPCVRIELVWGYQGRSAKNRARKSVSWQKRHGDKQTL